MSEEEATYRSLLSVSKAVFTHEERIQVAEKALACDIRHGFWPLLKPDSPTLINLGAVDLGEKMMLIVCELAEAMEEWRKPDVDITQIYNDSNSVIDREVALPEYDSILSFKFAQGQAHLVGFPIEMADVYLRLLIFMKAFGNDLSPTLPVWKNVSKNWKVGEWLFQITRLVTEGRMQLALQQVEEACCSLGADLKRAVKLKMEANEHRPYRHGQKRA